MNRDEETKEAMVNVTIDARVVLNFKSGGSPAFNFCFSYKDVPVSASDKAIEASVVDEIEKLYKAGGTIRAINEAKQTCIVDAEGIDFIIIEEINITRGETNEQ